MDLPAFLLSKNFYSESIGMPHPARFEQLRRLAWGLVWWDLLVRFYQFRVANSKPGTRRELAFQLSAYLSFR